MFTGCRKKVIYRELSLLVFFGSICFASLCYAAKLSGLPSLHQLQRDATRVERRLRPYMPSSGTDRTPTYSAFRLYLQVKQKKEECNVKLEIDDWR
ncbi:hypothetical protein Y032_0009g399 [Ancylostoma ceylanicum]|uniref:Uncharacterized protein n=1 Tax=Ancylostoma ceylanicum TaxID=53326 RepID=A0A016VHT8_9BILA|nr:hypothetical protein Y032_0009g399 [Ancylostoma ceylanicum]